MGLNFKQTKEIFGQDKAIEMFREAGIKVKLKDPKSSEYRKLSESAHGKILHQFLADHGIDHTHIGNESGQGGSKNIIIMMAKKKAQGVSKGFPDYIILIPTLNSHVTLYIELKKARGVNGGLNGSEISGEQLSWAKNLSNTIGSFHEFAHGSDEAIEIVQKYIDTFKEKTTMACIDYWTNNKYVLGQHPNKVYT